MDLGGNNDAIINLKEFCDNIEGKPTLCNFGRGLSEIQIKSMFSILCGSPTDQSLSYDKFKTRIQEFESEIKEYKAKFMNRFNQ